MIPQELEARTKMFEWAFTTKIQAKGYRNWLREARRRFKDLGTNFPKDCCRSCDDARLVDLFVLNQRSEESILIDLAVSAVGDLPDFVDLSIMCSALDRQSGNGGNKVAKGKVPAVFSTRIELLAEALEKKGEAENYRKWLENVWERVDGAAGFTDQCCQLCDERRLIDLFFIRFRGDQSLLEKFVSQCPGERPNFQTLRKFCYDIDQETKPVMKPKPVVKPNQEKKPAVKPKLMLTPKAEPGVEKRPEIVEIEEETPKKRRRVSSEEDEGFERSIEEPEVSLTELSPEVSFSEGQNDLSLNETNYSMLNDTANTTMSRTKHSSVYGKEVVYDGVTKKWAVNDHKEFRTLIARFPKDPEDKYARIRSITEALGNAIPMKNVLQRVPSSDDFKDVKALKVIYRGDPIPRFWNVNDREAFQDLCARIKEDENSDKYDRARKIKEELGGEIPLKNIIMRIRTAAFGDWSKEDMEELKALVEKHSKSKEFKTKKEMYAFIQSQLSKKRSYGSIVARVHDIARWKGSSENQTDEFFTSHNMTARSAKLGDLVNLDSVGLTDFQEKVRALCDRFSSKMNKWVRIQKMQEVLGDDVSLKEIQDAVRFFEGVRAWTDDETDKLRSLMDKYPAEKYEIMKERSTKIAAELRTRTAAAISTKINKIEKSR